MNFKCFFLVLLFLSINLAVYSQSNKTESWVFEFENNVDTPFTQLEIDKIKDAFGAEKLQSIISVNALEKYYKNILRNRVKIYVKKYYSDENFPKLSSIGPKPDNNINDTEKFNPLLYDFPFFSKKTHYYRVDKTDFLVFINPQELK